jgi:two-component system, cell cycle sensor histidine kinase and response regulator CckA
LDVDSSYGYFAGAAILFVTIIILLMLLGKVKSTGLPNSTNSIAIQNENVGVAMLMTSPGGDVVYANKAAKNLFDKYEFGDPKSPLNLDISNKNTISDALEASVIGSNIELDMNHGRDIDPVRVDQGQLEQVIINLCVNARDAMPSGGKLEIKTLNISAEESLKVTKQYPIFPKGDYVLLEVVDNGTGIEKKHLEKVFEPFFSTKDVGKGTGLGLSTVYGIIKQTNGYVFPESEVGVGTSFKIYLPRYIEGDVEAIESAADIIKPKEKALDLTGSSTILLVEDEDAVRMFASRALKNKGYTVYEADSGVSALKVLEETEATIDLLISDVMMPQMDGPSLVKKIRETDKSLKVIFISG